MIFDPQRKKNWLQWKPAREWDRLFYKLNDPIQQHGFEFVMFQVTSMVSTNDDPNCERDPYEASDTEVEILFHGTALFDGVRHLYFGHKKTDNDGYLYYADVGELAEFLKKIRELEIQYCPFPHWK